MIVLLLSCIVSLLAIFSFLNTRKPKHFPPGPNWLPYVGALPLIKTLKEKCQYHHLIWQALADKYGPIVGLKLGKNYLTIISSYDAIKEFYSYDEFNGRPNGFFYRIRSFNKRLGVVFTDGPQWEEHRRFTTRILRQIGMGRSIMNKHIEDETAALMDHLKMRQKSTGGEAILMHNAFEVSVLNVTWALVAGERFDLFDENLIRLLEMVNTCFHVADSSGGVLNQAPFLRHIPPIRKLYQKVLDVHKPLTKFILNKISQIEKHSNFEEKQRSVIQGYLEEINKRSLDGFKAPTNFTKEQLFTVCLDLFQAGTETTAKTLGFSLIYMLYFPEIAIKVKQELDSILDKDTLPTLNDRTLLKYTDAVLMEIQRIATVAPMGIVHRCMTPTKFRNYQIPENTLMLVSIHSAHMDPRCWSNPTEFRPERFLDENGDLIQHDGFLPFGLGKRRCLGEKMARSTLFLFFAAFMHQFDMELENNELPTMKGIDGITIAPQPFKVRLINRHVS